MWIYQPFGPWFLPITPVRPVAYGVAKERLSGKRANASYARRWTARPLLTAGARLLTDGARLALLTLSASPGCSGPKDCARAGAESTANSAAAATIAVFLVILFSSTTSEQGDARFARAEEMRVARLILKRQAAEWSVDRNRTMTA
jgi:hypothetical protein